MKAQITTKHFETWARIVLRKAVELGQKIAYMDLYCGPGTYDDGAKSTPLLVLEKAIANPEIAQHLITIFNDKNPRSINKLKAEVQKLPGIGNLRHKPIFLNETIGPDTQQYLSA